MKKRILFVDDHPLLLRGLKRMLFDMAGEWDMHFAKNGEEALEVLATAPFDVIVSDMMMPGMDGGTLLAETKRRYPSLIRIILSGHPDGGLVLKSIDATHQFLAKPVDGEKLKDVLSRAFSLHDLLADANLKKLVADLRSLPSLPTAYRELTQALQSPDVTMQELGKIISQDVGMTAKLMQMVNSAFFGLPLHISDPIHAAKLLGAEILRGLVLSAQIFSSFDQDKPGPLSIEKFTNHSLAVGSLSQNIAVHEKQEKHTTDDALIAGMLHDIGKLVLAENLPVEYKQAVHFAATKGITFLEAEKTVIGSTHTEVGAYLLGLWGMPKNIVEAVAFHHQPQKCTDKNFRALTAVHAADAVVNQHDNENTFPPASINLEYLAGLGMTDQVSTWQRICTESKHEGD